MSSKEALCCTNCQGFVDYDTTTFCSDDKNPFIVGATAKYRGECRECGTVHVADCVDVFKALECGG